MARPIPCDNHDDRRADVIVTNLSNGDTLSLCGACWVEFVQSVASTEAAAAIPDDELIPGQTAIDDMLAMIDSSDMAGDDVDISEPIIIEADSDSASFRPEPPIEATQEQTTTIEQ
jgi:hypothetical protein